MEGSLAGPGLDEACGPGSVPGPASGVRLGSSTCVLVSIEGITCQRTSEVPLWAVNQWLSDWPLTCLQAAPVLLARVTGAFRGVAFL